MTEDEIRAIVRDEINKKRPRILRIRETENMTGFCERHMRQLEEEGLFPKRFRINPGGASRAFGHLESEISQWILDRASSRTLDNDPHP